MAKKRYMVSLDDAVVNAFRVVCIKLGRNTSLSALLEGRILGIPEVEKYLKETGYGKD